MWIILFDTSSMQPADVQKAAAAAIKWASEKMTSADLVLVASISSTIQVFQDFTTNPDKIRTALNTFASSNVSAIGSADSGATANNDARLIGLKVICDALKPIQQKKAMLYFSSGMTRSGADNQAQYRAATSACANANVMIDTVDARGLQAVVAGGSARQGTSPQPPGHVGLSMVAHQAGSPVTLLQSTSNATDSAYVSVLVRNDSNKTIRSITFATVFHLPTVDSTPNVDKSNSASKTYVMAGAALSTLIKPTESGPLRPGLIDLSRLNGLADHGGAEVELGVVRVEFDDGSVWTYDVVTKGHFESGGH
jgi:hypothetical protein